MPRVDPQLVAACKAAVPDFGQAGDKPKLPPLSGARASSGEVSESAGWPPGATRGATLTYVPGSTQKINQLLGELDEQTHQPTQSRTESRYRLQGTDLGYSFEHQGKIYFLFGDTVGARNSALDSMATTADASVDPERGVRLDFLTQSPGLYLTVQPPGISMGAFEVPTAGLSLNGQMYVIVDTEHSEDWRTDRAVLTRVSFPITPSAFQPLRTISRRPDGKFIKMSLHTQPGAIPGLPDGGPFVLTWGTGYYRHSELYLSIVPAAQFEDGRGCCITRGSMLTALRTGSRASPRQHRSSQTGRWAMCP
jgi:hypothetical protein